MRHWITGAALCACAAVAHADAASDCEKLFQDGSKQFADKKLDEAAATFAKAYKQCGPGHGFLGAEGYVRATQGKLEDAAALYLQEIAEPSPHPEAFGNLERIRDKLSAATKAKIVGMGATAKAPVHVIGVDGEYSWARAFTCMGAKQLGGVKQSLVGGDAGVMLDKLEFACPDKSKHTVYFDYGGD